MATGLKGDRCADSRSGRGPRRELIIGDRQTGKTRDRARRPSLNQKTAPTPTGNEKIKLYCVYVRDRPEAFQRLPSSSRCWKEQGALEYSIIVAATRIRSGPDANTSRPFTGCTMGEYFRDKRACHAVIIYDESVEAGGRLSSDGRFFAARRPPGPRRPTPATCSILHSRLLERRRQVETTSTARAR